MKSQRLQKQPDPGQSCGPYLQQKSVIAKFPIFPLTLPTFKFVLQI